MLYIRSVLFNILWVINIVLQMVLQTPFYFFLSHKQASQIPKRWARSTDWLLKVIVGTRVEITGRENLLTDGCIVASKHQSNWDFGALNALVRDGAFILKAELMKIPFFGWYVSKLNHISIRREDKGRAMRQMIKDARTCIADGRQIMIFPEGTRKSAGAPPDYRYGVTRMYLDLNCPVVPVALDSGLYWPRQSFLRYPGILRARILEPIMPGLSGEEFSAELERRIEQACDELYRMASQDRVCPPLSNAVKARIAEGNEPKKP